MTETHVAPRVRSLPERSAGLTVPQAPGRRRADDILSLRHGLAALRRAGDPAGVSSGELAFECGISRAAAYRVLQTLRTAGFLATSGSAKRPRFRITPRTAVLFSGYSAGVQLLDVAIPIMLEWTLETGWPLEFSTLAGSQSVIRYATDHVAPRALARLRAGTSTPAVESAAGLVCLAFQAATPLATVVSRLLPLPGSAADGGARRRELMVTLARVRREGYARMAPPRWREATIAIPLWSEGSAAAALALRYMRVADGGVAGHAQRLAMLQSLREKIACACGNPPQSG
jgi:IclR family mhp operon transcriptional activator